MLPCNAAAQSSYNLALNPSRVIELVAEERAIQETSHHHTKQAWLRKDAR